MNQITREQAFDLAKYRYKIVDKEGNVYNIIRISDDWIDICTTKGEYKSWAITHDEIGSFYFILCRDLSQLTETIEHEGESFLPIVELSKIALKQIHNYTDEKEITILDTVSDGNNLFGCRIRLWNIEYGFSFSYIPELNHIDFRLTTGQGSDLVLNKLHLFDKLQSWHFNLGFPQ